MLTLKLPVYDAKKHQLRVRQKITFLRKNLITLQEAGCIEHRQPSSCLLLQLVVPFLYIQRTDANEFIAKCYIASFYKIAQFFMGVQLLKPILQRRVVFIVTKSLHTDLHRRSDFMYECSSAIGHHREDCVKLLYLIATFDEIRSV